MASKTEQQYHKVRWLGYSHNDDQWINAEYITIEILQGFWTKRSLADTFKWQCKVHMGFKHQDETKALMQRKHNRVMNLLVNSATINIEYASVAK